MNKLFPIVLALLCFGLMFSQTELETRWNQFQDTLVRDELGMTANERIEYNKRKKEEFQELMSPEATKKRREERYKQLSAERSRKRTRDLIITAVIFLIVYMIDHTRKRRAK